MQARIAETYRDVRGTQLMQREQISEAEAKRRTDTLIYTAAPVGLGAGAGLSTERAAQRELATMVARAERLLDQAQQERGSSAAKLVAAMRQSANEGAGHTKDMTPFMATDRPIGEQGGRASLPGDPTHIAVPPAPAISTGLINKAKYGRRIASAGAGAADWLFVDTWHTIGPFPNPARQNINTPYPPEAAVDLDATYPGKGGRTLSWKFVQESRPDITPLDPEEYGIYYAYTEVWFDAPRDAWVAVGSDDKSTLWIENQLVWMSSEQLKGWQIGEGLRYVHFKQGRNRILLRCENGWRGLAFSLGIALKP